MPAVRKRQELNAREAEMIYLLSALVGFVGTQVRLGVAALHLDFPSEKN